jgi:hypothetical protein
MRAALEDDAGSSGGALEGKEEEGAQADAAAGRGRGGGKRRQQRAQGSGRGGALPGLQELRGQWSGGVQAYGGGGGATNVDFNLRGAEWQWGDCALDQARCSLHRHHKPPL